MTRETANRIPAGRTWERGWSRNHYLFFVFLFFPKKVKINQPLLKRSELLWIAVATEIAKIKEQERAQSVWTICGGQKAQKDRSGVRDIKQFTLAGQIKIPQLFWNLQNTPSGADLTSWNTTDPTKKYSLLPRSCPVPEIDERRIFARKFYIAGVQAQGSGNYKHFAPCKSRVNMWGIHVRSRMSAGCTKKVVRWRVRLLLTI